MSRSPEDGGLTVMAEFINPVHQAMMDRYLLGQADVPPAELSQTWYDTGDIGTWRRDDPDVLRILSVIRARNRALPKARRIRVVGGNDPIAWPQVHSLEDLTRTPPKNRYAIDVIEYLLSHCPGERMVVQYGTYHVPERFLPHFSSTARSAFFYMGFIDPTDTCKRPGLSTFATVAEADACIGGDTLYAKTRDAVKAAYANGTGVAFQLDHDPSKYLPEVPIPPDAELDRRSAILKDVSGEELEVMYKRNARPQEMPACAKR